MNIPKAIQRLQEAFQRLPGIGPKTAQRLTFYLLHVPQAYLDEFASSVATLRDNTKTCSVCANIDENDPCSICSNPQRNQSTICIVEQPLDVLALEKSSSYNGLYHVLGGVINPLDNIGPDQLHMFDLLPRLKNATISELILATNPTMEGEATALFIKRMLEKNNIKINVSRIGRGLPTGADLQYADDITLRKALEGRREF